MLRVFQRCRLVFVRFLSSLLVQVEGFVESVAESIVRCSLGNFTDNDVIAADLSCWTDDAVMVKFFIG